MYIYIYVCVCVCVYVCVCASYIHSNPLLSTPSTQDDVPQDATETATKVLRVARKRRCQQGQRGSTPPVEAEVHQKSHGNAMKIA